MRPSEALVRQTTLKTINTTLSANVSRIAERLPVRDGESDRAHLARATRVIQVALGQCRDNPRLLDCNPQSVIKSVIGAVEHGLELGGVLGQAYLVPYKRECQMQVGYKGLITLALRSGAVSSVTAEVVHEADEFRCVLGSDPILRHSPALTDPGDVIAVYAVAYMTGGGSVFRVMRLDQIDAIRASSQGRNLKPWKDHWEEMAKKTAIRALCKYLPQAPAAHAAAVRDEYIDAGVAVPPIEVDDIDYVDAEVEEETTDAS